MKTTISIFIALFFAMNIPYAQDEQNEITNFYELYDRLTNTENQSDEEVAEGGFKRKMERMGKIWLDRLYPTGDPSGAAKEFYDYADEFDPNNQNIIDADWFQVSPTIDNNTEGNIWAGRFHRITFSPNYDGVSNQTIWACSSHGGLWKSTDDGESWATTNADFQIPYIAIADIAVSHQNEDHLVVATGFADDNIPLQLYNGLQFFNSQYTAGIYRSFDGGETWEAINDQFFNENSPGYSCRRIQINPANENEVYVATTQGMYKCSDTFGVSPSWDLIEEHSVDPDITLGNYRGIEYKPNEPETVYFSGTSIYKYDTSLNQYEDMFTVEFGFDLETFVQDNGEIAQINIATSAAKPEWLYAYVITNRDGVYCNSSSTFIEEFTQQANVLFYNGTEWSILYSFHKYSADCVQNSFASGSESVSNTWNAISVHNENPDLIAIGHTKIRGSVDSDPLNSILDTNPDQLQFEIKSPYGGSTRHADCHDLKFSPQSSIVRLFEAGDGGISVKESFSGIGNWFKKCNGINAHIIWSYDDSDFDYNIISQGQHDNATYFKNPDYNNGAWIKIGAGDGYGTRIDDYYRRVYRSGNTEVRVNNFYQTLSSDDSSWGSGASGLMDPNTPNGNSNKKPFDNGFDSRKADVQSGFEIHHINDGLPIFGMTELHQQLQQDLVPESDPNAVSNNWSPPLSDLRMTEAWKGHRMITDFSIAESDPNYVYVAIRQSISNGADTDPADPHFFISTTGFGNSVETGDAEPVFKDYIQYLPDYEYGGELTKPIVTDVAVSTTDPKRVWVTFNGFDEDVKVWSTVNPDNIWQEADLTQWYNFDPNGSLHNLPANNIAYQDGTDDRLFIGTDAGVWTKTMWETDWTKYGNMPGVRVMELKINRCSNQLRAATFGRGIMEVDIPEGRHLTNSREISEDTEWNEVGYSTQNILVKTGVTLTINADFYMPAKGYIRVEPGAVLVVSEGVTITNKCGALWGGIEVWGQDDLPQYPVNQGVCKLNGCTLENAHTGVWLRKNTETCEYVPGTGGGIVEANDVKFYNCYIGSEFAPYRVINIANTPLSNRSYFKNCEFVVDQEINGGFEMKYGIHLDDVNRVDIYGCDFRNETVGLAAPQGIGIKASNATFKAIASCTQTLGTGQTCPETSMDGNTFTNLDKGILASSTDQLNAFSAKNCHFEKCAYGIKAKNVNLAEIEKNTFSVNPDFLIEPEVPAYGVHLLACSKYTVENNEFYGEQNSDLENVGIVVSKSNPELDVDATQADYNRIYRNKFHDLYAGTIAQGSNSSGSGIDDIGLEILCGEYENNQFHIAVTNEGKIEVQQGSTANDAEYAARNFFYTQDVEEGTLKVNEDSEGFIYLYYNSEDQEPNQNGVSSEVFPSEIFNDGEEEIYLDFCPVHTIYNSGDNIYTVKSRYQQAQEEELEKQQEVEGLEDGGNSTYVGSIITDLTRTSFEVRNILYPMSPYLSERSLKGIIERQVPLTNWHLTELLIANSPLNLDVLNTYYENGRMEDFFHNLILLYQTGESSLNSLKAIQKEVTTNKQLAKSKYLKLILFELEEAELEAHQLEEVLEAEKASTDHRFKFDRALQSENYFIAQQLIDTYSNSTGKDAFGEIAQIRLDRKMSGDDCCQLSVNHVNILQSIADSEKEGKFLAQALLANENEIESEEIIILPEIGIRKSLNSKEMDEVQQLELFEIYPNPTSDFAYFTFLLPEGVSKSYISVYDTSGKQMEQIDLSGIRNVLRLDVSNYDSGVYAVSFTVDGRMISKKSMVVTK